MKTVWFVIRERPIKTFDAVGQAVPTERTEMEVLKGFGTQDEAQTYLNALEDQTDCRVEGVPSGEY